MRKSIIYFSICLAIPFFTQAQTNPIPNPTQGVIRYLVTHNWVKKMDAVSYLSKQQKERAAYMWGNDAEWKEYATLFFSPTGTKYEDSKEEAEDRDYNYSWRSGLYFVKRDYENGRTQEGMEFLGKKYLLEDSLHCMDWKILNDMKEVAGHICMNASWEDTIKQQKVIAWFALDMPLAAGPERFCGLPGLILEVNLNDGALIISADKITPQKLIDELEPPKKIKAKKISEAKYFELLREHMAEKKKNEEPYFWGMRY
jgi:GLPGLI family protein